MSYMEWEGVDIEFILLNDIKKKEEIWIVW